MPAKKTHQVLVKLEEDHYDAFDAIARQYDRPRGYIVRLLALRGLELYQKDHTLVSPTGSVVASISSDKAEIQRQLDNTVTLPKKHRRAG